MTNDELNAVAKTIADVGSSFYFQPETVATAKANGLDRFRFYFLGRGGVLGDVEADVVHSAFGYFEPGLFAKMWNSAKAVMAPRDCARLFIGCGHEFGRSKLGDVDGLDAYCYAATLVTDAIDPTGLALYSGIAAEPVPDDLPAQAIHLSMALREARGSAHLLAIVASGLTTRIAHQIRRPDDVALFGWPESVDIVDAEHAKWEAAETLTNTLLAPSFAVLDDDARRAFIDGASAIHAALTS